ncbi:MAG TPA: site-2 protease family protein [Nitrospira sp.]|nr:site-2 protease family protein [Nitrospira sp.]
MQIRSWEIGRALGIPIRIHASWFVVFFLATWTLSTDYLPETLPGLSPGRYWVMGAVAAVLLFLSVLLHELGHSYVALYYRIPIEQITLFLFGGVAHMRQEAPSPKAEFLIAIAGPIVSFVISGICLAFVVLAEAIQQEQALRGVIMLGLLLGMGNLQLGIFNLIPGFPLDGGRILRAGLWALGKDFYRATKQAAMAGLGFGLLFVLWGLLRIRQAATGELDSSMIWTGGWLALIGIFLYVAALASRRQAALRHAISAVKIQDMMVTTVVSIPSHTTLDEAVNRYFQAYGYGGFPVVDERRLIGLVTVPDIQAVSADAWSRRRVDQVMRPFSDAMIISPDVSAIQAMGRMAREGWDRLVVVQDGEIVGLVTHSALVHFLQLRSRPVR